MPAYPPPQIYRSKVAGVFPRFVTCADVAQLKAELNATVVGLQASLYACPKAATDGPTTTSWAAFQQAWNTYYQASCGWDAAAQMDRGEDFQRQLRDWGAKLQALGCNLSAPLPPDPGTAASGTDALSTLKVAGYAVAAVAVAVAVVKLANFFKE